MSSASGKWDDLTTRTITAVVLAAVAGLDLVAGGWWFFGLVSIAAIAMNWELATMLGHRAGGVAVALGLAAGGVLLLFAFAPGLLALGALVLVSIVTGYSLRRCQVSGGFYSAGIMLATWSLYTLRVNQGLSWALWLILVVIASDVAGYMAGRAIGGRKFWPSISPKKTWSGTIAGWVAAALVGAAMVYFEGARWWMIPLSAFLAFAGQMGDIAESALKRQAGVKDSSNLLPGHGGLLDRFDALLGATIGLLFILYMMRAFG